MGHPTDREHVAANRQRAGHRQILADADAFERGDDRGGDRDRRAVAVDTLLAGLDKLDVDILLGDVLVGELFDNCRDILHRLLGHLLKLAGGDHLTAALGRRDLGHHGQHDTGVLAHHCQAVDAADLVAVGDLQLVILPFLDELVGELLFDRSGTFLGLQDVIPGRVLGVLGAGDIAGDADKSAEITEVQRELALPAGASPRLKDDLLDRLGLKRRQPTVVGDLLSHEADVLLAHLQGVVDGVVHVDLVAVPLDTGAERGVHVLHGVEVAGGDHDEIRRHRLGLHHRPRGAFALAGDRELTLLDRGHQLLLGANVEGVDLVDEQHTLVGFVDRPGLNAVVAGRLHPAGLEGVVAHVAEQRAGVGAGGVLERRARGVGVVDQQIRDHRVAATRCVAEGEIENPCCQNPEQDLAGDDEGVPQHDSDDDPHQEGAHLIALAGLLLVGVDDLFALPRGDGSHLRLVAVVGVVVDQHILELLFRQELGHRLRQHRFASPWRPDHHDVSPLAGGLDDHIAGVFLADDLVDEAVGDLHVLGAVDQQPAEQVVLVWVVSDGRADLHLAAELLDRPGCPLGVAWLVATGAIVVGI